MEITRRLTGRGFVRYEFQDLYGHASSLQKSSLVEPECIWLGVDDLQPQVLHGDARALGIDTDATCGWVPYPIPDCVNLHSRMHLSQDQVKALLPALQYFAEHGELPPE